MKALCQIGGLHGRYSQCGRNQTGLAVQIPKCGVFVFHRGGWHIGSWPEIPAPGLSWWGVERSLSGNTISSNGKAPDRRLRPADLPLESVDTAHARVLRLLAESGIPGGPNRVDKMEVYQVVVSPVLGHLTTAGIESHLLGHLPC